MAISAAHADSLLVTSKYFALKVSKESDPRNRQLAQFAIVCEEDICSGFSS
jgi:hypothetical protein